MKKQIQLFKTTNKKRPLAPIGSVCTVATEMKTSAKRQKVNALNKSPIKHDEGINSLFQAFRQWRGVRSKESDEK